MKTLIFVLGGMMAQNPDGTWRLARHTDIDPRYGCTGEGYWRAVAAAYLWKEMTDATVVVTGGRCGFSGPDVPFLWSLYRRELLQLGVSESAIDVEPDANTTYLQLRALSEMLRNGEEAIVVTSRYHITRAQFMLVYCPLLQALKKHTLTFQAAEDVLIHRDAEKWEREIREAYNSESMKRRHELETKGICDLMAGQYKFGNNAPPVA